MARATTIFIFLCMGVIAASVATIMMFQFARPFGEALSLALALLCTMIVVHLVFTRQRERGEVSARVAELEERVLEVDEDIGNLEGRMTGMETNLPRRTREEIDPLFAEVEVLGSLIKQMAEAMAGMEDRIDDQDRKLLERPAPERIGQYQEAPRAIGYERQPVAHADAYPQGEPERAAPYPGERGQSERGHPERAHPERAHPERGRGGAEAGLRAPMPPSPPRPAPPDPALRETIRDALDHNRVDLFLQPLVTLPNRQVRFYEALTRIRDANDVYLEPVDFIDEAERARMMPAIDNLMLFRAIQVLRRLTSRNRRSGLFVNLSAQTLVDERFFPGFLDFLRTNEGFDDQLIFEFSQRDVAEMGALELESLAALADLGFRFSMDRVTDLKSDFKTLSERGFRYMKLHASRLIGNERMPDSHIHPDDLGDLLRRFAIELIVDHIETEAQVLEVLDLEVRFGQGYLFSPPRPVRPEVLKGQPPRTMRRAAE
ncbi:EAL domain-containing protein [Stappia sp.]|uniref:EAL domain-containing protein n=1 Tax=Stappia sp. TaxID=1870903 RepID=UPI0032D98D61